MAESTKENASVEGGASFTKLAGGVNERIKKLCSTQHTSDIRRELHRAGLGMRNTHGVPQRVLLLRVLEYLGTRGISSAEAIGCGYERVEKRIQELEADGWKIDSLSEKIADSDGLQHVEIARYFLRRRLVAAMQLQSKREPEGA
jgi:biotin operon repressor